MKCQLCRQRKATTTANDTHFGEVHLCAKCRRSNYPTAAEILEDEMAIERQSERNAEFASVGDYW